MFRYKLYLEDGTEIGEAVYAQYVKVGETIWAAGASKFRVLDLCRLKRTRISSSACSRSSR